MDFCSVSSTRRTAITLLGIEHNITAVYLTAIQREYSNTLYQYERSTPSGSASGARLERIADSIATRQRVSYTDPTDRRPHRAAHPYPTDRI
ncbi:hypothetical protein ELS17_17560 [Natrinema altunense]|uniref:Uncharacterized protein n=1 Tax=Natrinema altunense TaxID=222984 RepID=A0A482Y151_9EURY|nr:hypothetical protein ELS17_17560 [Natrinema altunense]